MELLAILLERDVPGSARKEKCQAADVVPGVYLLPRQDLGP